MARVPGSTLDQARVIVKHNRNNPLAQLCLCEDISVGDKVEQEKNRKPGNKGQVAQGAQPKKTGNQVFQEFQVFRDFRCFLHHGNSFGLTFSEILRARFPGNRPHRGGSPGRSPGNRGRRRPARARTRSHSAAQKPHGFALFFR